MENIPDSVMSENVLDVPKDTRVPDDAKDWSPATSMDKLSIPNVTSPEVSSEISLSTVLTMETPESDNLTAQEGTGTLSSFTLFPKLPAEVRLMIWRFACYHSRNLDIWAKDAAGIYCTSGDSPFRYASSCPAPAVLWTSREARTEGPKHYDLLFECEFDIGHGMKITAPPRIYINFRIDYICPLGNFSHRASYDFGLWRYNRIAININNVPATDRLTRYPAGWLRSDLEEVIIYESTKQVTFPTAIEFETIGSESKIASREDKRLEHFRNVFNSLKGSIVEQDKKDAICIAEEEHKKAGSELPQSLREEIEDGFTSWLEIKIMKLKESEVVAPE